MRTFFADLVSLPGSTKILEGNFSDDHQANEHFDPFPGSIMLSQNLKPPDIPQKGFKLLLHVLTAAKQTIVEAWKCSTLSLAENKSRINSVMLHKKKNKGKIDQENE